MPKSLAFRGSLFAAATLVSGLLTSPAQAAPSFCNGVRATIVSSSATVFGTSARDVIVVRGSGAHTVRAGAGNDLVCASPGADTIFAGAGNDIVLSGGGNDVVNGGAGNDFLSAGGGADQLLGSFGSDRLVGGTGADLMNGGASVDNLNAGSGENICANDPADTVTGECSVDSEAPAVTLDPSGTEIPAGSQLTISFSVSDPAGVAMTMVFIGGPSGWVTDWCGFGQPGELVSGDAQSGVYTATCAVPQNAVSQKYTAFIHASDFFGTKTAFLSFDFTVTGGVSDAIAPTFQDGYVDPASVSNGQVFNVHYTVADESGVGSVVAYLMLNGGGFAENTGRAYATSNELPILTSGDALSGAYLQPFVFNEYAPAGIYTVWVSMRDIYGNKDFVPTNVTVTLAGPSSNG